MDHEQQLALMRSVADKARQAAMFMEYEEDRAEMVRLAAALDRRADELEAKWLPANPNPRTTGS
jgi:hypothetical protein